jgi:hypothetical protein
MRMRMVFWNKRRQAISNINTCAVLDGEVDDRLCELGVGHLHTYVHTHSLYNTLLHTNVNT